ncbi:MAG: hypothetical protein ACRENE_11980, partial [Polyangiaceae bacterium]
PTLTANVTVSEGFLTDYWDTSFSPASQVTYSGTTASVTASATRSVIKSGYHMYDYGGLADREKIYWEIYIGSANSSGDVGGVGIVDDTAPNNAYIGSSGGALGFGYGSGNEQTWWNTFSGLAFPSGNPPAGSQLAAGNCYMFALDMNAGKLWVGMNGTWWNSGNPAGGTAPAATGTALQGSTSYVSSGTSPAPNLHPAVVFYGSTSTPASAGAVSITGHFSAATYYYNPPFGF